MEASASASDARRSRSRSPRSNVPYFDSYDLYLPQLVRLCTFFTNALSLNRELLNQEVLFHVGDWLAPEMMESDEIDSNTMKTIYVQCFTFSMYQQLKKSLKKMDSPGAPHQGRIKFIVEHQGPARTWLSMKGGLKTVEDDIGKLKKNVQDLDLNA